MAKQKNTFPGAMVVPIKIPPPQSAYDRLVDSFAEVWNAAAKDPDAYKYLMSLVDERAGRIKDRLYDHGEWERRKLAELLLEFADAVYRGVGEFVA